MMQFMLVNCDGVARMVDILHKHATYMHNKRCVKQTTCKTIVQPKFFSQYLAHTKFTINAMESSVGLTRNILTLFTVAACLSASAPPQPVVTQSASRSRPVLLLVGDSLTEQGTYPDLQGWAALLQSRYTRSTDVITRGLSGHNTKWFLKYAFSTIQREISEGAYTTPSLITVWFGTNDGTVATRRCTYPSRSTRTT
ncbi:unnamed protein product [Phytophthora lilii]|uniref:Unnamed protein product n=1 Tax=Phytophthora lilii TaxID=2077276 RepID=A0A9W6XFS5_9STRA|nr:unnamed protein product [Phytophthora lilii]